MTYDPFGCILGTILRYWPIPFYARLLSMLFKCIVMITLVIIFSALVFIFVRRKHEIMSEPVMSVKATLASTFVPSVLTTRPWPTRQNGLVLAVWYHTPGTTANRFSAGLLLPGTGVQIQNDMPSFEKRNYETVLKDMTITEEQIKKKNSRNQKSTNRRDQIQYTLV